LPIEPEPTQDASAAPRSWLNPLRNLAMLLLLAVLVALGFRHASELDRLASADPLWVAGMALSVVVVRVLFSELTRHTLAQLGHRIAAFEVFGLTVLSAVPNLLVPRSGFGALGMVLRARHGVPLATSGSLLLPLTVLDLLVVATLGLLVQATLIGFERPHSALIAAAFAAVLVAAGIALFVRVQVPFAPPRLTRFLANLGSAWRRLRQDRGFALRAVAMLLAITGLRTLRLELAFGALDVSPQLPGLLLASLLGDVMFMLALTPGALGLREAAIVYCAQLMGVTPAASLAAAVLDRLVMTLAILVMAQLSAWKLFGRAGR
jgi:uncharacterized membrane protein YbhN (UPF0104 family)